MTALLVRGDEICFDVQNSILWETKQTAAAPCRITTFCKLKYAKVLDFLRQKQVSLWPFERFL